MGFFYDWHGNWHEHGKRKRHRQKLNDWHNDWHGHSKRKRHKTQKIHWHGNWHVQDKRKRHKKAHLIFQLQNTKKMILITEKVRISLKNDVVAKQKRLLHDTAIFGVQLIDFLKISEIVPNFKIVLTAAPSGSYFTLEYSYQGNDYKYYLVEEQTQQFEQIAKDKNIKYKLHEI